MGQACSTYKEEERWTQNFGGETEQQACHFVEDLGVDGKITKEWILQEKTAAVCGLDSSGSSEHGTEISGFIKFGEFLHLL